ncbi:MAG: phenylacetate--CoA ligase, partial [Saprospiraceae bacterium]|nr:phenylacetate--CoA ligase [Saprospiraceae bacterium]
EKGTGSYIWEDHFFPEVIDPDTFEPVPYGQTGILLLTTLTKEVMPMIRYCTNDICSLSYEYSQKRTHIKMSSIRGRADSMLIIRGVNLFPTQIEEVIGAVTELSANYQIVVSSKERLDTILVKVEAMSEDALNPGEKANLEAQLMTKFRESIGLNIPVQVESPGTIPRSEGGKLNRVIDLR